MRARPTGIRAMGPTLEKVLHEPPGAGGARWRRLVAALGWLRSGDRPVDRLGRRVARLLRRPPAATGPAVAAGLAGASAAIAAGWFLIVLPGGTAPMIAVYPVVMSVTLLIGPLAGWIALIGGFAGDWYFFVGHQNTFVLLPHQAPSLIAIAVAVTFAQVLSVVLRQSIHALGLVTDRLGLANARMKDALTQRTEAQAALERSEAQYRASFEYASVGKAQSEPVTGRILRVNRAFAQMLGYEPEELIGRTGMELTHPDDRDSDDGAYRRFLTGDNDAYVQEKRYIRKDGRAIWCRASATAARAAGSREPIMLIGVIEDIDERRQVREAADSARRDLEMVARDLAQVARGREEALGERDLLLRQKESLIAEMRRTEDLRERLIEQLTASNEERTHFAHVASHDLREPLRMVTSFCGLLAKDYGERLDDRGRQFLSLAVAGGTQMSLLLDDLVDFGRLGLEAERGTWFAADEVLRHVLETLAEPIRQSGAEVAAGDLPQIFGNAIRFDRLLQNLIGNALKFVPIATAPRIRVAARRKADFWIFSVSDNGIGIAERHQRQIFEPFKRLHATSVYSGAGLGLAISRKIVEGFGGLISVDSVEGEGSTFSFTVRTNAA
ncbi:MAG: PAS domain S-box protein [Roseiarcus sp.]